MDHDEGAGVTYFQALVIALVQGVTELFPVSSLGHSVLIPAWFGGSWQAMVTQSAQQSSESSFYLAYIVALHCATALALMWFFRADWVRIIRGFFRSLPASVRLSLERRRPRLVVADKDERLAWMIIFATIPVGLTGVALEHAFRTLFAKPGAAAVLLFVNGLILLGAEALRRSAVRRKQAGTAAAGRQDLACGSRHRTAGPPAGGRSLTSTPRSSRTLASRGFPTRTASGSARHRSSRCWRGLAGPGSPWPAGCGAAWTTRTRPGSPSCWPPRSSWRPGCSRARRCSARPARTSTARSSWASSSAASPPTCRSGSSFAGSRPGR